MEDILFDLVAHTSWTNLTAVPHQDLKMFLRFFFVVPVIGVPGLAFLTIFIGHHLSSAIQWCHAHCGPMIPSGWGNPWPTILDVTQGLVLSLGLAGLIWLFIWAFMPLRKPLQRFRNQWLAKTRARLEKHSSLPWKLNIVVRIRREHTPGTTHHYSYTDWFVGFGAIDAEIPNEPLFAFEIDPFELEGKEPFLGIELLAQASRRSLSKQISFWVACVNQEETLGLVPVDLSGGMDFELPDACLKYKVFQELAAEALRAAAIVCGYHPAPDAEQPQV